MLAGYSEINSCLHDRFELNQVTSFPQRIDQQDAFWQDASTSSARQSRPSSKSETLSPSFLDKLGSVCGSQDSMEG